MNKGGSNRRGGPGAAGVGESPRGDVRSGVPCGFGAQRVSATGRRAVPPQPSQRSQLCSAVLCRLLCPQDKYHLYFLFDLMSGGDLMDVLVAEAKVIKRRVPQGGWRIGCLAPKVKMLQVRAEGPGAKSQS